MHFKKLWINGIVLVSKHKKYFMGVAELTADQSHCNRKQVGAVLVRDNFLIASGRNGTIPGHDNCCEEEIDGTMVTNEFTLHAEQNVLAFCNREGISTKGSTMYTTLSPCKTCSKLIAACGVTKVIYSESYRCDEGVEFLERCGITVEKYSEI